MKKTLLFIAVLLVCVGMFAQPRSEQEAVVSQQKVTQQIRKKVASARNAAAQNSSCYIINDEVNQVSS